MRRRSSNQKPVEPADLTTVVSQAVETVTRVVTKVVIDPEPVEGLPPADLVPEAPPPAAVRAELIPEAPAKNAAAVALGKLGGSKGGAARAKTLTPQRRSEIARKAALARWAKKNQS